jgi:hypothetical protein
MTDVVIIQKTGELKQINVKSLQLSELYKKCGFRKSDGFALRHTWKSKLNGESICVSVFSRDSGKANTENKYDLPPPVDTTLYFGNLALVAHTEESCDDNNLTDLTTKEWNLIYEKLFGGFEDLNATADQDEFESDELDSVPSEYKTKSGYLKDGFVVDSGEDDDEDGSYDPGSQSVSEDEYSDEDLDGSELDFEEYEYQEDE